MEGLLLIKKTLKPLSKEVINLVKLFCPAYDPEILIIDESKKYDLYIGNHLDKTSTSNIYNILDNWSQLKNRKIFVS